MSDEIQGKGGKGYCLMFFFGALILFILLVSYITGLNLTDVNPS